MVMPMEGHRALTKARRPAVGSHENPGHRAPSAYRRQYRRHNYPVLGYITLSIEHPIPESSDGWQPVILRLMWQPVILRLNAPHITRPTNTSLRLSISGLAMKHIQGSKFQLEYRGTSRTRKRTPLGPCRRPTPRVLGGSKGGGNLL